MKIEILLKPFVLAAIGLFILSGFLTTANAQHNTGTPQYAFFANSTFELKIPWATNTSYERTQVIYNPGVITVMGGTAPAPSGTIRKVYLRTKPGASKVYHMKNVVIKLGETTDTAYPNQLDVPFKPCTEVFKQNSYTVSTPGWIEFELSTPFTYDNKKGLVVELTGDDGFLCTYKQSTRKAMGGDINKPTGSVSGLHSLFEFGFDFNGTSVEDAEALTPVQVYPNPASGMVHLSADGDMNGTIIITDLNGRMLLQEKITGRQHRLSVASLNNGMYFYKIFSAENLPVCTGKLTVSH